MTMGRGRCYDGQRTKLVLAVYGDSPRSARALENIKQTLCARGIDAGTLEIVDVMTEPRRALELQLVAAPQLLIGDLGSNLSLYGDLSDQAILDGWLDEMLNPDNDDPATTS